MTRKNTGWIIDHQAGASQDCHTHISYRTHCLQAAVHIAVWGGAPPSKLRKVQVILNSAAQFVTGLKRTTSTAKLMANCNWMFATELANYHTLLTLWRIMYDEQMNYFDNKINLTNGNILETMAPRLNMTTTYFRWRAVWAWNSLDEEMRNQKTYPAFKKSLRKSIIQNRILGRPP